MALTPTSVIAYRSRVAIEEAQRAIERAILATPTSKTRNALTDINLSLTGILEAHKNDPQVNPLPTEPGAA